MNPLRLSRFSSSCGGVTVREVHKRRAALSVQVRCCSVPKEMQGQQSNGSQAQAVAELKRQQQRQPAEHHNCDTEQQQQQQQQSIVVEGIRRHSWSKHMSAAYMTHDRDWAAVEEFYVQLVAGCQCLSAIGLRPAGQPAAGMTSKQHTAEQQQPQQQKQKQRPVRNDERNTRITYKLDVSYLGGSFCGWCRGNTHNRPSVQDTLAAAIAATGLCDRGDPSSNRAKRVAGRAAQRAFALQQAAAAAAVAVPGTSRMEAAAAVVEAAETQQAEAAAATALPAAASGACAEPAAAGVGAAAEATGSGESTTGGTGSSSIERQMPKLLSGGRTDAGVTAVGQVASFYSWQPPVPPHELISRINQQLEAQWAAATTGPQQIATAGATCTNSVPNSSTSSASSSQDGQISSSTGALSGSPASPLGQQPPQAVQAPPVCPLRVWGAVGVPRQFHPTFGASWRRYVYLLPLRTQQPAGGSAALLPKYTAELQPPDLPAEQQAAVQAAPDVDVDLVNALLRPLEGQRLNYYAFARDTPKGKDCECTLLVARASLVMIPIPQQASWSQEQAHDTKQHQQQHWQLQQPQHQQAAAAGRHGSRVDSPVSHARCPCLAVELVGDRFLRRMVRVLVGTLVREAVAITQAQHGGSNRSESHERLLHLLQGMDRTATAGSAPALGLCFAAVGYD